MYIYVGCINPVEEHVYTSGKCSAALYMTYTMQEEWTRRTTKVVMQQSAACLPVFMGSTQKGVAKSSL